MNGSDQLTNNFIIAGLSFIAVPVGRKNQGSNTIHCGEDTLGRNVIPRFLGLMAERIAAKVAERQLLDGTKVTLGGKLRHNVEFDLYPFVR
jgi:hypothetical protein